MKEYPDDFPWREIFKEAIPFLVILVAFFTVMAAVSAPSIAWMIKESGKVEELKGGKVHFHSSTLPLFNFPKGGAK